MSLQSRISAWLLAVAADIKSLGQTKADLDGANMVGLVRLPAGTVFKSPGEGGEGGELQLEKPMAGSSLSGNVVIDISGNDLRIFDSVTGLGFRIDMSTGANGASRNIFHEGALPTVAQVGGLADALAGKANLTGADFSGAVRGSPTVGEIAGEGPGSSTIQVFGELGFHAAYMHFHRPGQFAVRFGIDVDNKLKLGGWSLGSVAYELYHSGNKQPGNFAEPITTGSYAVAALPADGVPMGAIAYATDGRKVGEAAGAGTGVMVYRGPSSWRVFSSDTAVAT